MRIRIRERGNHWPPQAGEGRGDKGRDGTSCPSHNFQGFALDTNTDTAFQGGRMRVGLIEEGAQRPWPACFRPLGVAPPARSKHVGRGLRVPLDRLPLRYMGCAHKFGDGSGESPQGSGNSGDFTGVAAVKLPKSTFARGQNGRLAFKNRAKGVKPERF